MYLRHRILLTCIAVAGSLWSTASAQISSNSNTKSSNPTSALAKAEVPPFDQLLGIDSKDERAVLYRSGEDIAIVDLTSGEVAHHLPLSRPMQKALKHFDKNSTQYSRGRMRAFFTKDPRFIWILGVPQELMQYVSKEDFEPTLKKHETVLELWDLRTSELVGSWSLPNRFIQDVQLVQVGEKELFVFLERDAVEWDQRTQSDFADSIVAYSILDRKPVANRTLRNTLHEGSLEAYHGELFIKSRLLEAIDFNHLQLKWESPRDWSGVSERFVRGKNSLIRYRPDFGFIDRNTSYGTPQSSIIELQSLDYQSGKASGRYRLQTKFEWTNGEFQLSTSDADYTQKAIKRAEASQNPPLIIASMTSDGVWLVKNDSKDCRTSNSIAYLQFFDGKQTESFNILGFVFDGYSNGLITSKGVWTASNNRFTPFVQRLTVDASARNSISETKDQQSIECVGVGNGQLLYLVGEQLKSVGASEGQVISSWPLPSQWRRPLEQQDNPSAFTPKVEAIWLECDKSWVVALPDTPENFQDLERVLMEQVQAKHSANLAKMGSTASLVYSTKPDFNNTMFYDAKTNLIGWDFNLLKFGAGQPAKSIMRTKNTVCIKLAATKDDVQVLEVSADPRQVRLHQVNATKKPLSTILVEQKKSIQDQVVEQLSHSLTLSFGQMLPNQVKQNMRRYQSMLANRPRNYSMSAAGHETIIAVADPHVVFMREVRIFKGRAQVEKMDPERSFLVNESDPNAAPGGMTLLDFADDSKSPMTLCLSLDGRFVVSGVMHRQDSENRLKSYYDDPTYLDIRDLHQNKRVRYIPLGKHLEDDESINSIALDSEAKHVALNISNRKESHCKILRINNNKLLATISGNPSRVFTEKGMVLNGEMIADLDQLALEGESAFRVLKAFTEPHRK